MNGPVTPVEDLVRALRALDRVEAERLLGRAASGASAMPLEDLVVAALERFGED